MAGVQASARRAHPRDRRARPRQPRPARSAARPARCAGLHACRCWTRSRVSCSPGWRVRRRLDNRGRRALFGAELDLWEAMADAARPVADPHPRRRPADDGRAGQNARAGAAGAVRPRRGAARPPRELMAETAEAIDVRQMLDVRGSIARTREILDELEYAISWSGANVPICTGACSEAARTRCGRSVDCVRSSPTSNGSPNRRTGPTSSPDVCWSPARWSSACAATTSRRCLGPDARSSVTDERPSSRGCLATMALHSVCLTHADDGPRGTNRDRRGARIGGRPSRPPVAPAVRRNAGRRRGRRGAVRGGRGAAAGDRAAPRADRLCRLRRVVVPRRLRLRPGRRRGGARAVSRRARASRSPPKMSSTRSSRSPAWRQACRCSGATPRRRASLPRPTGSDARSARSPAPTESRPSSPSWTSSSDGLELTSGSGTARRPRGSHLRRPRRRGTSAVGPRSAADGSDPGNIPGCQTGLPLELGYSARIAADRAGEASRFARRGLSI